MIVGDVLQFVVYGRINSQVWNNTYTYLVNELSLPLNEGEFPDIVESFGVWYLNNVNTDLLTVLPASMLTDGVRGENLFNVAEIGGYTFSPPLAGSSSAQELAQFNSYRFTTPSLRRGMNSGQRRMPGVTETDTDRFGNLTAGAISALQGVANSMSVDITLEFRSGLAEVVLQPIIVKRVREGAGTPTDPYTYRLPRTTAERVYYLANGWTINPYITTQNSRKTGRGQ